MGTGRLEAFSDGVFAIAVTLLVLDLKVPRLNDSQDGSGLLHLLAEQWPSYLAFVTSFVTILIMWVNHHLIFKTLKQADHILLLLNGLLLLCVTFVPFPTSLVAEYLRHNGQGAATAVYSGSFVVLAVAFTLLRGYAARYEFRLNPSAGPGSAEQLKRRYLIGPPLYLIAFALAFINAWVSLGVCVALAVLFAIPMAERNGAGDASQTQA